MWLESHLCSKAMLADGRHMGSFFSNCDTQGIRGIRWKERAGGRRGSGVEEALEASRYSGLALYHTSKSSIELLLNERASQSNHSFMQSYPMIAAVMSMVDSMEGLVVLSGIIMYSRYSESSRTYLGNEIVCIFPDINHWRPGQLPAQNFPHMLLCDHSLHAVHSVGNPT